MHGGPGVHVKSLKQIKDIPIPYPTPVHRMTPPPQEGNAGGNEKEMKKAKEEMEKDTLKRLKKAMEGFQKHVLTQIIRGLKDDPTGKALLIGLLDDPSVLSAFTMHGLLKPDLNARVAEVVEGIREYAQSHGGDVEFVRVEGDVAFVRMKGNCSGCSLSALTLKRGVEDRLKEEVPEIARIEVLPTPPGAGIEIPTAPDAVGWVTGPPFVTMRHGEPVESHGRWTSTF